MKSGKDEGKPMDPLFPRLHINDADKGGPRAPPRNKMALCEQYNVPSQNPSPRFNSGSMLSLQTSTSTFTTRPSSSNVESPKQKVLPALCSLPGPSHFALTERYRSYYSGGLNFNTSQSTESSSKPHCFQTYSIKRSGGENDLRVPSSAQPRLDCKRDGTSGIPERIMRKRCSSAMDEASQPFPILEENGIDKNESIKECSNYKDCESDNSEESSDTSVAESISGLDLTPDDVIRVIGQRLFWKARKTIINQQRLFSVQIFELHRLIKLQRLITGSPDVLHENNFNLNKPSIKFPPMNKLLYVTPLDSSQVIKTKAGTLKSNPSKDHGQEHVCAQLQTPLNNAQQSSLNPSPIPASIPIDTKLPPLYFHPPPGNQWLVPVRSPSEGLIYKPYTGPCPPTAGIMAPVFGNCGPVGSNSVAGTMPGPRFSGTALGQSYLQPYAMPLLNASSANLEPKQVIPFDVNLTIPCRSSCSLSSKPSGVISECSKGSEVQGSSATSPDRFQGDVLSLFPTTPSVQVSKDKCNEQKVQVIKVVPHNPRLATESAARIYQSIQEERKKT
ncbi:hypothetical protein RD792_012918 [Penstemon davidsonii]|uniref:Uncharacterized protein n=1 Tax=Penstemon davidsonii TaxID=160366 RepID=A0ABR0CY80_9LAMI|nr:hypothetical protein RD792_012918 [Penstemon davidsonii]